MELSPIQYSISSMCLPLASAIIIFIPNNCTSLYPHLSAHSCSRVFFFLPRTFNFSCYPYYIILGKTQIISLELLYQCLADRTGIQVLIVFAAHTFRMILQSFASPTMDFTTSYQSTFSASSAAMINKY